MERSNTSNTLYNIGVITIVLGIIAAICVFFLALDFDLDPEFGIIVAAAFVVTGIIEGVLFIGFSEALDLLNQSVSNQSKIIESLGHIQPDRTKEDAASTSVPEDHEYNTNSEILFDADNQTPTSGQGEFSKDDIALSREQKGIIESTSTHPLIERIYWFDHTSEPGSYKSLRDFDSAEITYVGAVWTKPDATITTYRIDPEETPVIREYAASRIPSLTEVPKETAKKLPRYIMLQYLNKTERYFEYSDKFCTLFDLVAGHRAESGNHNHIESPRSCLSDANDPVPASDRWNIYGNDIKLQVPEDNDSKTRPIDAESKILFCEECGNTLRSNSVFCSQCGTKVNK